MASERTAQSGADLSGRRARGATARGATGRPRAGVLPNLLVAVAALALAGLSLAPSALAAGGLSVTTPFPAVAVDPGNAATFELTVKSTIARRVDLALSGVPTGWSASLRGGGFVVEGVSAGPGDSPKVTLDVNVPDNAAEGTHRIVVRASSGADTASLALDVHITTAAAGAVDFTSDFTQLHGAASATFSFNLDLHNDTAQDLTFTIAAQGPEGWDVTATPSGQAQASSVAVTAGSSSTIAVSANPPDGAAANTYPIHVEATAGSQKAQVDLQVEITGSYSMTVSTPDDVLSNHGTAGSEIRQQVTIENTGTAPLEGLTLTGSPPSGWKVTFEPTDKPAAIAPTKTLTVTAVITPSNDALAGDYNTSITARNDQANGSLTLRTTVETSQLWAIIGIALIAIVIGGLFWVFRTYGRR